MSDRSCNSHSSSISLLSKNSVRHDKKPVIERKSFKVLSENTDNEFSEILKKQNEISAKLVECHIRNNLPKKEIEKFDGTDLTKFKTFMNDFERTISNNCNEGDQLAYL